MEKKGNRKEISSLNSNEFEDLLEKGDIYFTNTKEKYVLVNINNMLGITPSTYMCISNVKWYWNKNSVFIKDGNEKYYIGKGIEQFSNLKDWILSCLRNGWSPTYSMEKPLNKFGKLINRLK